MARSLGLKAAVARGAALLDEKQPGWWRRVDTAGLDMTGECVIYHVYGSYADGTGQLFGDRDDLSLRHRHGFTLSGVPAGKDPDNWAELDRLWVKAVEQRRAAAAQEGEP